jgi:hypothetical protein
MSVFGVMCTAGGMSFAFPDVCLTPAPPAPPVPIPYPNSAQCPDGDGTGKVKITGSNALRKGDTIRLTAGDEAGNAPGGTMSGQFKGSATVRTGCPQVKAEGKDMAYHTVLVGQNGNSANSPAGTNVAPSQQKVKVIGAPMSGAITAEEIAAGLTIAAGPLPDKNANQGTPDQFDQNCPSANASSESMDSLTQQAGNPGNPNQGSAQAALKWMQQVPGKYQNGMLGADGGGGFLPGTCGTTTVKAGTILYRYFGGAASGLGRWWSTTPLNNPVMDNALPPGNTGEQVMKVTVRQDTEVLTGAGAPRCSNKPGGPPQLCFPQPKDDLWENTFSIVSSGPA